MKAASNKFPTALHSPSCLTSISRTNRKHARSVGDTLDARLAGALGLNDCVVLGEEISRRDDTREEI